MRKNFVGVRVEKDLADRLKKGAILAGKSVSEFAGDLIKTGLENRPSGGNFNQDSLAILVENAVKNTLKKGVFDSNSGANFPPEGVHFLFETLAKIHVMVGNFYKKGMTIQDSVNADSKIDTAVKADLEKLFKGGKS